MRLMCAMLQIPEPRRTLYLATCAHCGPRLRSSGWKLLPFQDTQLQLADLNPHCVVCDVIQQAHRAFPTGDLKPNFVRINYDHRDEQHDHLPVDFFHITDDLEGYQRPHIQLLYVQLYSQGTQVHTSFYQLRSQGVRKRSG